MTPAARAFAILRGSVCVAILLLFINFELAIDPDMLPEGADPEDVAPGSVLSMKLMHDIALGLEPEPGYYYKAFTERQGGGS